MSIPHLVGLGTVTHGDARGWFREQWRESDWHWTAGFDFRPRQFNVSKSRRGVIRGLHYQFDPPMAKLMTVLHGRALLVAVNVNPFHPLYRSVDAIEVSGDEGRVVFAPAYYARGFQALEDDTIVAYLCDAEYGGSKGEGAINPLDRDLAIPWREWESAEYALPRIMSPKDEAAPTLREARSTLASIFLPEGVDRELIDR